MNKHWIHLALALTLTALAQSATPVSLKGVLQGQKVLVSLELQNTKPLGNYQKTNTYGLKLKNPNGTTIPLLLWLAPANGKTHVAYASAGYVGPFDREGMAGFGYLSATLASYCMGLSDAQRGQFQKMGEGFFPKLTKEWTHQSLRFGDITATIAGQLTKNGASVNSSFENRGIPGKNGWRYVCGLE